MPLNHLQNTAVLSSCHIALALLQYKACIEDENSLLDCPKTVSDYQHVQDPSSELFLDSTGQGCPLQKCVLAHQ